MKKQISVLLLGVMISMTSYQLKAQSEIKSGKDVVRAMHEKYEGRWYENITFEQETTFYGPNEEVQRTQIWYEAIKLPGRLAIKFDDLEGGDGILFKDGVQYGFADGEKIQETERIHDLLVLAFDVYGQSPDSTFRQLETAGYNLDEWYEDNWEGKAVYVVGTSEPSMTIPQFWIEKERLLFVRNITVGRQNSIQEVQFNKYEQLGDGWIAPEVIFIANGQKGLLEEYTNIETPDSLSDDIFDPEKFLGESW
ncbi:MAG: hypothetical protein WD059_03210 [Balneolaceae bacterium]